MEKDRFEDKFENYFHFLSTKKHADVPKPKEDSPQILGYPQMYAVYILKNDNTPTDFLITLIKKYFHKTTSEAIKTAIEVNKGGKALCQVYTRDTAETKVMHVLEYAQKEQQDIKCIMQKRD